MTAIPFPGWRGGDILLGGAGNDALNGGEGNDTLDGGDDIDTADYSLQTDSGIEVVLTSGAATLVDGFGDTDQLIDIENVIGSQADDTFSGDSNHNQFDGQGGIDTVSFERSEISSGVSASLADGQASYVFGGITSEDQLSNIENLTGSDHGDQLSGDGGANILSGGGGADTLLAGDGNDTLHGGDHNDIMDGEAGDDWLNGDAGNDTFISSSGSDTFNGGEDTDLVDYSNHQWGISADLSNGVVTSGEAGKRDILTLIENLMGTVNDDVIIGNELANVLTGLAGNDSLSGGSGSDELYGNAGQDILAGGGGDDRLEGGGENDILTGGLGNDDLYGGEGTDIADYSYLTSGLTFTLSDDGNMELVLGAADTDTLYSIEGIIGTTGNDTLIGSAFNNILDGHEGEDTVDFSLMDVASGVQANLTEQQVTYTASNGTVNIDQLRNIEHLKGTTAWDTLVGDAGNNILEGGNGNDTLNGGGGDDTIDGGSGVDTAVFDFAMTGLTITLKDNSYGDVVYDGGTSYNDQLVRIENLYGSNFNDTLTGSNNENDLYGLDGDDTLIGNSGHDELYGGEGNDTLYGDDGYDRLYGGEGDDTFYGGKGIDRFVGGNEDDRLAEVGEGGFDTVNFSASSGGVEVDFTYVGTHKIRDNGEGYTEAMISIEQVIGSGYTDTFTGEQGRHIYGEAGDDILKMDFTDLAPDTVLNGGSDSDTLISTQNGSFDLSGFTSLIDDVEIIDFTGNGADDITVSLNDVSALTGGDILNIRLDNNNIDNITVNDASAVSSNGGNTEYTYTQTDADSNVINTITVYYV